MRLYPSAQSSCQKENLFNTRKRLLKTEIELFPQCAISNSNKFFTNVLSVVVDPNQRNPDTYGTLKKTILKFIRPSPNSEFDCHHSRLRLGLGHLHEHKFKHSFQDSLTHYEVRFLKMNQLHISCSTVPLTTMIGPPS